MLGDHTNKYSTFASEIVFSSSACIAPPSLPVKLQKHPHRTLPTAASCPITRDSDLTEAGSCLTHPRGQNRHHDAAIAGKLQL